jgi:hypothetical protein
MVLLSGACSASPIKIRANTPMSLQRFNLCVLVFTKPCLKLTILHVFSAH